MSIFDNKKLVARVRRLISETRREKPFLLEPKDGDEYTAELRRCDTTNKQNEDWLWMRAAIRSGQLSYVQELVERGLPLYSCHMYDVLKTLNMPMVRWCGARSKYPHWRYMYLSETDRDEFHHMRADIHTAYQIIQYHRELHPDAPDVSLTCVSALRFFDERKTCPEIKYCLEKLREHYLQCRGRSSFLNDVLEIAMRNEAPIEALDWLLEIFPNEADFATFVAQDPRIARDCQRMRWIGKFLRREKCSIEPKLWDQYRNWVWTNFQQ